MGRLLTTPGVGDYTGPDVEHARGQGKGGVNFSAWARATLSNSHSTLRWRQKWSGGRTGIQFLSGPIP